MVKVWNSRETATALTLTEDRCAILLRTQCSNTPGKGLIYCNLHLGCRTRMGELLCSPGWRGTTQSAGIPLPCCKLDLLKCTILGMEHTPLEEGSRWGPGLAYPTPVLLTPGSAASSSQHVWFVQPGHVSKAANLPLLRARGEHFVFPLVWSFCCVFVPSIGL